MKGLSCVVLLGCLGMSLAMRTKIPPGSDPSKVLMKRDYKGQDVGGGHSGGGASAPLDSYGTSGGTGDNGYYYYYYPVDEATGEKDIFGDKKDKCDAAKIMAPLIVIAVFLGIIAANAIGLLPAFNLANVNFGALNLPGLQIGGTGLGIGSGRRDTEDTFYEESWGPLGKLTTIVTTALDSEQCLSRLVCESGKYAEGRTTVLSILEIITPPEYQNRMKIFKDSALKKSDCKIFKCTYTDKLFY